MQHQKQPCAKDCPDRTATCHAECKKYLEWLEIHKQERAEHDKLQNQKNIYNDYARQRNKRLHRIRRYKGDGRIW